MSPPPRTIVITGVITGASSGIGRASAHAFAAAGFPVVLSARRQAALEAAAEEGRALGAGALPHAAALPLMLAAWPFRPLGASLAPPLLAASTGSGPHSR
ncbi:SDR family NAD(P)-dependent oxidoreductase [Roseococcus suduntuyensis]|uniref:NAD(P)-dependent dehydrogenase (Short-subunit alcohol dehydrogenase family) n=1 Tax=Roseococcus suduntuyensis TaxID=455361 RepID=A0A840AC69_9PROT|nr:SDR family NAD(P)-dependent oxidoreductase [Roseococcus suduntuyensis]MBB3899159.1 NAD(P)-dependent dehydrogenase (short-subunit alcohol dehydrogenase family) [Roseococcus suduntuyensis]